jgi:hypothetical protein
MAPPELSPGARSFSMSRRCESEALDVIGERAGEGVVGEVEGSGGVVGGRVGVDPRIAFMADRRMRGIRICGAGSAC